MDAVPFRYRTAAPVPRGPRVLRVPRRGASRHTLLRLVSAVLDGADEREVLWAALAAIGAAGPFAAETAYTADRDGTPRRCPRQGTDTTPAHDPNGLDRRIAALGGRSGRLDEPDGFRLWALALRHRDRCLGYLVVRELAAPTAEETADAELLARRTGVALAGLADGPGGPGDGQPPGPIEPAVPNDRQSAPETAGDDAGLRAAVTALAARQAFHDALARAAVSGRGEQGILRTLYEHTGLPALTEDRFGNLRAWAGPDGQRPSPGPAEQPRTARGGPGPVRDRELLLMPVEMAGDLLGLAALVDPDRRAAEPELAALEQTALALAPGLAHERRIAELEPRLRHDLVERLVSGEATDTVLVQAAGLGHDLRRPHRVAVLRWSPAVDRTALGEAVARAARRLRLDALVGARGPAAVALLAGEDPPDALYRAVAAELGRADGAVGIGARCEAFTDLPHSYDEAVRALTVRRRSQEPYGSTGFDELGLYRMMGTGDGEREADRFVREWLGALLDYDARHHTDLVSTLSRYLETGGSYDATAETLLIHRSTVRYRLQRIREITGHDLGEVETRLNLHVACRIRDVLDPPTD